MPSRRKKQFLPGLKRVRFPRTLIVFDTETHSIEDENGKFTFPFRLGVARLLCFDNETNLISNETFVFHTIDDFINILTIALRRGFTVYIYAHNIGFDVRVLYLPDTFHKLGWTSEPPLVNNRVFMWRVKTKLGTLEFMDTANFGVETVKKLGLGMGLLKGGVDFKTVNDEDLVDYCKQDVAILETFLLNYIDFIYQHKLGDFKMTIAAQAMTAYRYKFMGIQPYIHMNEDGLELERDGYFGGRVECFRIGKLPPEPYYYLDVNSMYPYVMQRYSLPHKFKGYSIDIPLSWLKARLTRFYVIADVTIETETNRYPKRYNGRLCFPVGRFRTVLHHHNLLHAMEHNEVQEVHRCVVYQQGILFREYVDFFYPLKQQYTEEGNLIWREISKLFQNALYGKFGQMNYEREFVGDIKKELMYHLPWVSRTTHKTYQDIAWYGKYYRETRQGESTYSCPAISAAITALARLTLWEYMVMAGLENVYYCDTDSLIVNQSGMEKLLLVRDRSILGYLKVERLGYEVIVYGNKDYEFGKYVRHKGVPPRARVVCPNTWEYMQFTSFTAWLNRQGEGGATATTIQKRRLGGYHKGDVDEDGIVKPYRLPRD